MAGAGLQKQLPIVGINLTVVTHHQSQYDARISLPMQNLNDALPYKLACSLDGIAWFPNHVCQLAHALVGFNVACSAYVFRQRPRLKIEAVRIDASVRSL